ncbi:hypothetical protein [Proteus mirabilis]|uniref:hypothetical protein n=1 Tax=Proteus mirabilis TaxID=584 RepID=UPI001F037194|nr:hypothetical protein [Proteus mirabilis]
MAKSKKEIETEIQESADLINIEKEKTCFVIMPISDHPDYDNGHFKRVYDHIISPACKNVGYKPVIATDSKASNLIMFNILKNIVECDMAICDLSTKNANVFYELGLRQAFNKKTILITDGKEREPFDITGFRYVKYSPSLRIDTVERNVNEITEMLKETEIADENEINSIVNLLKIQPAKIDSSKEIKLGEGDTFLLEKLNELSRKIDILNNRGNYPNKNHIGLPLYKVIELTDMNPYNYTYDLMGDELGIINLIEEDNIVFKNGSNYTSISIDDHLFNKIRISSILK